MNWKTTSVLLAIAVALTLYVKFYDAKLPGTEEGQRQAKNVINFSRDKIEGILIQNGDDKIDLRRRDQKWRLEVPVKDQADSSVVDNLLSALEDWQKDATISPKEIEADKGRLGEYGLNKPKLRLKLIGPGAPAEIWFGKEAALEGKMYVRLENSRETFLVPQSIKKEIEKKADDFRDKKLTDLTATQVTKIVLKTAAGEIELQKKNEHWEILKPLRARGDDQKIGDLIAHITTAQIQKFVADDHGDLRQYGLAEPRGSVTLFGQEEKQGQILQIGVIPEKAKEEVYVRFSPRSFVYTVPKKIESILETKPNDLRDRRLVRIDKNILDRMTIDAPGKTKTTLARKGESWTIVNRNNAAANASEAQRLVDMLNNEPVTRFVEDVASNLTKYGLDKPQLQVTFSSFASENTAETQAGEHPFASVSFGKVEGDNLYARVGDEPFVVAVRRSLLDNIFADPIQWQERAVFKFKPEQIHRFSVVTDNEHSLTRGANNQWNWVKGSGAVNQSNVQSLLNTLSALHAVRWIGANAPPHAFEKPQMVVTFTTSPDDKALHKLTVGGASGDGMWFARVDEREGVFLMNTPDLNALKLPLVQPPAPSPPAGAGTVSPARSSGPGGSPVPQAVTSPVAAPTP
jgi:hypothetical protein